MSCYLIEIRAMMSLKKIQWIHYMKEAYRVLKPGVGWIQCCEFNPALKCDDDSVPPTAVTWKVFHFMEYLIISFKKSCINY